MAIKVNYDQPILGHWGRQNTFKFRIGDRPYVEYTGRNWSGEVRGGVVTQKKVKFEFKQNTNNFRIG